MDNGAGGNKLHTKISVDSNLPLVYSSAFCFARTKIVSR